MKNIRHGMYYSRFYAIWRRMKYVCTNEKSDRFKYYGGRGIKIEWDSFLDFKESMYVSYIEHAKKFGEPNTTIERINNNGNYSTLNCKWATRKQQAQNRSNRKEVTFHGKTHSITEWAEINKIPKVALWLRLNRFNWSIEKSLTTPCHGKPRK